MAGRPSNRSSGPTSTASSGAPRQNEYFVPRDGIDREVITSDICRYLGNDALVRPGTYESPDGRITQGYYITAYRNLTSAMIQDLKADSARWEQERRAASRTSGGGAGGSREPRGQDYSSWKNSQREAQYDAQYGGSSMDIDYAPPPGPAATPVYTGQQYAGPPPANYPPATYPPPVHPPPAQYQTQPGYAYPPNPPPPAQYSPPPQTSGDRHPGIHAPPISGSYSQDPGAYVYGSNYQAVGGYPAPGPNRMQPPVLLAMGQNQITLTHRRSERLPTKVTRLIPPTAAPSTTPTTTAPAPLPTGSAPPPRRDPLRDSEPRDPRGARRPEPEREDRDRDRDRNRHHRR
ncbi:hypothetical protein L209DRAFT_746049 [Thermothelomyces heterothallicus CBS 203.75]